MVFAASLSSVTKLIVGMTKVGWCGVRSTLQTFDDVQLEVSDERCSSKEKMELMRFFDFCEVLVVSRENWSIESNQN